MRDRVGRHRSETRRTLAEEERAEEAVRHRFADGEIDEEEYVKKLKVLRESVGGR